MKVLNKQYSNVCLESSKRVRLNSVVLVRNIANEPKREPLKIARIEKIHDSRDNTQRVVTLTYHNVRKNKDGEWIKTPVKVDRSINDLVLVDDALNESMLNPSIQKEGVSEINTDRPEETNQQNDENDETRNDENDETRNDENDEARNDEIAEPRGIRQEIRRSKRDRKQPFKISPDEIGECDDENDKDYK